MRFLRPALSLLLLIGLGIGHAAASDLAQRARTLGVLVLAGHEIELARVGAMVFWNKRSFAAAPDDALSEVAFKEIKAQIDQEQHLTVTRVPVEPDDLVRLAEKAHRGMTKMFVPSIDDLKDDLAPYRAACGCDALIVVSPARGELVGNQSFKGFAWVAFTGFDETPRRSVAVAYVTLSLVDARSGDVVDSQRNWPDLRTTPQSVSVASDLWPKEMAAVGGDQWPSLVQAFGSDLQATLRRPLFEMGLKPSCGTHFHEIYKPGNRSYSDRDSFEAQPPPLPAGADPSKCR